MGNLSFRVLLAGLAGVVVWLLFEPFKPGFTTQAWLVWENAFIAVLGLAIGLAVGGYAGYIQGSNKVFKQLLILGGLLGFVGIALGHTLGSALLGIFPGGASILLTGALPVKILARTLAFAPMGALLGAGIGLSSGEQERTKHGLIGGLIGGVAAGALFDILGAMIGPTIAHLQSGSSETGGPSRAMTALLFGVFVSLFIGIVERIARSAWVRLELGRNEGKEWPIYGSQATIGRDERATIPLFSDPDIAKLHATITRVGPAQYMIADAGSGKPTLVNGQPVTQALLAPGAQITVGRTTLTFLMKAANLPAMGPEVYGNQAYNLGPVPMPTQGIPTQGMPAPQQPYSPTVSQQPYPGPSSAPTMAYPAQPGSMPTMAYPQPPGPGSMPTAAYPAQPQQQTVVAPGGGAGLLAMDGPLAGQRFEIRQPTEVGRECPAIPMSQDAQASRRHATLVPVAGGLQVHDLGSTNGTHINGQRVPGGFVKPGDMLKIGSTTFRVDP